MAENIDTLEAEWADVPQLETDTDAIGGKGGAMNGQALALVKRVNLVRDRIDATDKRVAATVSIKYDFGALLDGTNDDTASIAAFLSYCAANGVKGIIEEGVLAIRPTAVTVAGSLNIECRATIKNIQGAAATGRTLRINGGGAKRFIWIGGSFDANGGAHSLLYVSGFDTALVDVQELTGITCTSASAADTSGVVFDNCRLGVLRFVQAHDFAEGTATQGSIPRVGSFQASDGVRSDGVVMPGFFINDAHGGFVIGNIYGGNVLIQSGLMRNLTDNGIYNAGNASEINIHGLHIVAAEEPVVNNGSGVVNYYGGSLTDFTNSISLNNCGGLTFRGTKIATKLSGTPSSNIFKTREGNTSSSFLRVYGCEIVARTQYPPVDFAIGNLLEFVEIGNRWTYIYDGEISQQNKLWSWTGTVDRFESDSLHEMVYQPKQVGDTGIAAGDYFIELPAPAKLSRWNSRFSNLTGNSAARFRLNSIRRQLVEACPTYAVENITSDSEVNRGRLDTAPPRQAWGIAVPTTGYWPRDSVVRKRDAVPGGAEGWRCVVAGTPGTWVAFGITDLSVTVTYDPPPLAVGTAGPEQTTTIAGAALGDYVVASFSRDMMGMEIVARVSAADTVKWYVRNPDGNPNGTQDLASGTVRLRIISK